MEYSETHHRIPPPSDTTCTHDGGYLHGRFFTNNPNPSPANSISALKVEGVTNRFLSFVNEEGETIKQEFGSVTIARGVQGDNPYATITENRSVILKQREMIRFLLRELNAVYLHPTTVPADYLMNILLAGEIDDYDDDYDDDIDDLGRLHSVTMSARFDDDDDDDDEDDEHLRRRLW